MTAIDTKLTKAAVRKFPKKDLDKATRNLFDICAQGFMDYTPGGNVGEISYKWAIGQLERIMFEGFRVPTEPVVEVVPQPEPVEDVETLRSYNVLVNKLGRVTAKARIPATEPQIRYISRLLNERNLGDLDGKVELARVLIDQHKEGKLSKRSASEILDILVELPMKEGAEVSERRRATEKQLLHVVREGARRVFDDESVQSTVDRATAGEEVFFDEASKALDLLFNVPFRPREEVAEEPTPEPEAGFYVVDGEVYKVVRAIHGSGRMYAKRLDKTTGEWEIDRGAVARVRPTHKMSLEQARETANVVARDVNGALYGRCFVCSTTLTDEKSIEIGMGPVCRDKF